LVLLIVEIIELLIKEINDALDLARVDRTLAEELRTRISLPTAVDF
jgi:hypothetical protein